MVFRTYNSSLPTRNNINCIILVYTLQQLEYAETLLLELKFEAQIFFIRKDSRTTNALSENVRELPAGKGKMSRLLYFIISSREIIKYARNLNEFTLVCPHFREVAPNCLRKFSNCKSTILIQDGTSNLFNSSLTQKQKTMEILKTTVYRAMGIPYSLLMGSYLRMDLADAVALQNGYPKVHEKMIYLNASEKAFGVVDLSNKVVFIGQENLYDNSGKSLHYFRKKIVSALTDAKFRDFDLEYVPRYSTPRYTKFHNELGCKITDINGSLEAYIAETRPSIVVSFTSTALINTRTSIPEITAYYVPIDNVCYRKVHNTPATSIIDVFSSFNIRPL